MGWLNDLVTSLRYSFSLRRTARPGLLPLLRSLCLSCNRILCNGTSCQKCTEGFVQDVKDKFDETRPSRGWERAKSWHTSSTEPVLQACLSRTCMVGTELQVFDILRESGERLYRPVRLRTVQRTKQRHDSPLKPGQEERLDSKLQFRCCHRSNQEDVWFETAEGQLRLLWVGRHTNLRLAFWVSQARVSVKRD